MARLRALTNCCDLVGIEVFERSLEYAWDKVSDLKLQRRTLFGASESGAFKSFEYKSRLKSVLLEYGIQVLVIPGWSGTISWSALGVANDLRTPVVIMSESQEQDGLRNFAFEFIKRRILGWCNCGFVGGSRHREYLVKLGMSADAIFEGYDVIDNFYFENRCRQVRNDALYFRERYQLPNKYFLASARFIPKKNLVFLIKCFAEYHAKLKNKWIDSLAIRYLVLLGDGKMRSEIEMCCRELAVKDFVHMPGFVQYPDLPIFYGLASAFVHSSTTEQWGLVVNEAMASSLPVIVSDTCGCLPELVQEGVNGWSFDPSDGNALVNLLLKANENQALLPDMGKKSFKVVSRLSPGYFASNLLKACEKAFQMGAKPIGLFDRVLLWGLARM
jgi:glycosyltransferase involved in cell wall biosynthesis